MLTTLLFAIAVALVCLLGYTWERKETAWRAAALEAGRNQELLGELQAAALSLENCSRENLGLIAPVIIRTAEEIKADNCDHDWVDARNEYVKSGEWCPKCNSIRPGNEATGDREPGALYMTGDGEFVSSGNAADYDPDNCERWARWNPLGFLDRMIR